jgi:hypothetical protein
MQAGGSDHVDQGVEAKQSDLATHEIRDAQLGNSNQFGGLRLAWSRPGDMILQSHHQRRTELHVYSLRSRILNCILYIGEAFLAAGPPPETGAHPQACCLRTRRAWNQSLKTVYTIFVWVGSSFPPECLANQCRLAIFELNRYIHTPEENI